MSNNQCHNLETFLIVTAPEILHSPAYEDGTDSEF